MGHGTRRTSTAFAGFTTFSQPAAVSAPSTGATKSSSIELRQVVRRNGVRGAGDNRVARVR
jgi:hypothetical protein